MLGARAIHRGRSAARHAATTALAVPLRRRKRISAMVRVKNEEECLGPAIESIADLVDEVVIIDNLSTDQTPSVIAGLTARRDHVRTVGYPHEVRRVGRDNLELAASAAGRRSPHLLATYYNWCLAQCRHPFALKWDGDMVATPELEGALEAWRSGPALAMSFRGANVHPDRAHLLAARHRDPDAVGHELAGRAVPSWVLEMTHTAAEFRLFPRLLARYDDGYWWCERLTSPFLRGRFGRRHGPTLQEPLYLHLKFCKRRPHENQSDDFAAMLQANLATGPALPGAWARLLEETVPGWLTPAT